MKRFRWIAMGWCMLALMAVPTSWAKRIDLSTLPSRTSVQLTIYNSEDLTLVKETRYISFKKGNNRLQFSWTGTLIDPTSVTLRPLQHSDKIRVVDTTFPGNKPKHLIWNIRSGYRGQVKVEVSYFTSGLTWRMDYVAITNPGETQMKFRGYVRVFNKSGETYPNAQVRLIVGKINLVEKIAALARRSGYRNVKSVPPRMYRRWRRHELHRSFGAASRLRDDRYRPKKIVKEGLSEYFMFTIEGTETLKNGWSKRLQAVKAKVDKFKILYRLRSYQYGAQPVRFFIWHNSKKYKLGESPLPNGTLRIFRRNPKGSLSYLGQKTLRYVPIKAAIEVNLGRDALVVFRRLRGKTRRFNFAFRRSSFSEHVVGWEKLSQWGFELRNYRNKPIAFELRQRWSGDVRYASTAGFKRIDYRTVQSTWTLKARGKLTHKSRVHTRHGSLKKQSRVRLQSWPLKP